MYSSGGTSKKSLLPPGPSRRLLRRTRDVNLEGIVVDNPSNDPQASTVPVTVPRPRPLNLADNYEIVGGVPAFVWRHSLAYIPKYHVFAISSNGTCMASRNGRQNVSVYDMLDNFSLVAEWSGIGYETIRELTFHNNQNNELVVVFDDSTVALLSLSFELRNGDEESKRSQQRRGVLEIKQEFRVLDEYDDITQLMFGISHHGVETWVCAWDYTVGNIFSLCSITQDGIRRLQIKSDDKIALTLVHCSILQKALTFISLYRNQKLGLTRVWTDFDFDNKTNAKPLLELDHSQSFGFSDCGSYFLTWNYSEHAEHAIEVYDVRLLKTSTKPMASRSIGRDVLTIKGQILERDPSSLGVLGFASQKDSPIVAFLVVSSNEVNLTICTIHLDQNLKEMAVTLKEMTFSDPYHVEFSISPNVKWFAIGSWTDGLFGLFSLLNGTLVWSIQLRTSNRLDCTFIPLKFDPSSSRLIVNACATLYVFALPCLQEHQLEFKNTSLDLVETYGDPRPTLNVHDQPLIPKQIFKQALLLKHRLKMQDHNKVVDVANSRVSSNVAILVQTNGWFKIVKGPLETMFAPSFKECIKSDGSRDAFSNSVVEFNIDILFAQQSQYIPSQHNAWIFLHPNEDTKEDLTIIFLAQDELLGVFIDVTKNQVEIPFGNQECFALKQSKDGSRVACLHAHSVTTLDLNKRSIIARVPYGANLEQWLVPYIATRNQSCFEVSHDATTILIGWDTRLKKPISLTSQMDNEGCKTILEENEDIVPCWPISEDFKTIAFLEFNNSTRTISSICTCSANGNDLKRITKERWNLHSRRILTSLTKDALHEYALQLDERTGHLWTIALRKYMGQSRLILIPLSPYSLNGCIPSLYMQDYPTKRKIELKELASAFGRAFLTMHWNGKTNFQLALENKDKAMLMRLVDCANERGICSQESVLQSFEQKPFILMRNAIKEQNEAIVAFLLYLVETKACLFEDAAMMLKEGFEGLWLDYRALLEPKILNKTLEWTTCELEVPIDIFDKDANVGARIGTSNSKTEWQKAFAQGNATTYWMSLHQEDLKEVGERWSNTTTTTIVVFFTIANICKIGLNGIVRFLLMQDAPSYIFQAPLLKWVIAFKWEKLWKKKSFKSFIFYLCFVALYSLYSIWIAFCGEDLNKDIATSMLLTIILCLLMTIASRLLYQEYLQMRSYIQDGNKLFHDNRMWGLQKYISSVWNLIEVLTYLILILVIPILHFANLGGVHVLPILYTFVALETLLICIKVWYYAQAFEGTGAFVLMIENIIKDCVPFLALAFAILVAFSFSLFVLFQHSLHEKRVLMNDGEEDEVKTDLDRCFGDPAKAMVTLFYAMIGTFEPKVYYHSGSLSPIITLTFVIYLAIQMIVMVNMLIAIMGDTFDRVKSTEEEQLLMGRARFIDACEAQLSRKEIEDIENSIGKYLYVLLPKDRHITLDMKLWQGRVKTIEGIVGAMITDLRSGIMKKLKNDNEEIKEKLNEILETNIETNIEQNKIIKKKETRDELKPSNRSYVLQKKSPISRNTLRRRPSPRS